MKNMNRFFCRACLFGVLFFLGGCLENYGTIRVASGKWGTTIKEIEENWQEYDIYYAGLSYKSPSAIMFDPKRDGRRLIGVKWMPVTDRSVTVDIIEWLDSYVNYPPTLWKILGPEGKFFGYIYTSAMEQVVIERIDPNTLKIENIPLPPIDYGGGIGRQG
ncbi:MAG: hypothetical protein JRJ09_05545 [Deltaproteobacteria bacterium]|nr:hypothetical protein [Deltaproteobacteria bacterium]MBW2047979.1 hypothetical protein [Deltaproteobacteria bacterium]MBW2111516.1 hypothetical protein [Deltaproteobacteria bacterium]HDZ91224.1 hypothetical protein [Deltaproteobacteria bacterium]